MPGAAPPPPPSAWKGGGSQRQAGGGSWKFHQAGDQGRLGAAPEAQPRKAGEPLAGPFPGPRKRSTVTQPRGGDPAKGSCRRDPPRGWVGLRWAGWKASPGCGPPPPLRRCQGRGAREAPLFRRARRGSRGRGGMLGVGPSGRGAPPGGEAARALPAHLRGSPRRSRFASASSAAGRCRSRQRSSESSRTAIAAAPLRSSPLPGRRGCRAREAGAS